MKIIALLTITVLINFSAQAMSFCKPEQNINNLLAITYFAVYENSKSVEFEFIPIIGSCISGELQLEAPISMTTKVSLADFNTGDLPLTEVVKMTTATGVKIKIIFPAKEILFLHHNEKNYQLSIEGQIFYKFLVTLTNTSHGVQVTIQK